MLSVWLKSGMRYSGIDISVVLCRFLVLPSLIRLRSIYLWLFQHIMKSRGFPVLCKKPLSKLNGNCVWISPPPPRALADLCHLDHIHEPFFQRRLWHIKRTILFTYQGIFESLGFLLLLVGKFQKNSSKLQIIGSCFTFLVYTLAIIVRTNIGASNLERLLTISE